MEAEAIEDYQLAVEALHSPKSEVPVYEQLIECEIASEGALRRASIEDV